MRSEEVAPDTTSEAGIPSDSNNTGTSSSSSSNVAQHTRGAKRVSENDRRADLDEAQIEMAKRAAESGLEIMRKRGEKRLQLNAKSEQGSQRPVDKREFQKMTDVPILMKLIRKLQRTIRGSARYIFRKLQSDGAT